MKLKMAIAAVAVVASVTDAPAALQEWTIDLSNLRRVFYSDEPGTQIAEPVGLTGHFTGADANGDGVLTTSELGELDLGPFRWPGNDPGYGGELDFHYASPTDIRITGSVYRASLVFGSHVVTAAPGFSLEYRWTPMTVSRIEGPALAVPEPDCAALVAAGIVLLYLRVLRTRSAARIRTSERGGSTA